MINKLADLAGWLGRRCIAKGEQTQEQVYALIARAKYWKDVEIWLRGYCRKPFREIREERVLREAE